MAAVSSMASASVATKADGKDLPSIFELLAQESLMNGLRPALKHIIKFASAFYPRYLCHLNRWFDEVYLGFDVVLQDYCLKRYGGSFAENFYSLKRVLRATGSNLPQGSRFRSLFILTVIPYLKLKMDGIHSGLKEKLKDKRFADRIKNTPMGKVVAAFVRLYPYIQGGLELWALVLQVGYLISKADVHSPWLLFAGVRLENLSAAELAARSLSTLTALPSNANIIQRLAHMVRRLMNWVFHGLSKMLGLGLFFIQFLDYWNTSEKKPAGTLSSMMVPPAPQETLPQEFVLKMDPGMCPICNKRRRNDTALSVSGYVFCYSCIFRHVQAHHNCPVTKLPATTKQLIRLFIDAV